MNTKYREPEFLQQGKKFHRNVQKDWLNTAEGKVVSEKWVNKRSGRKGRIDIFVESDEGLIAIGEIKNSDWDTMTLRAVRQNARRQIHQIWNYIESQLELGRDVSPGVIFPKRPKDSNRMNLIEELFEEEGIPVVWQDESVEERKSRK